MHLSLDENFNFDTNKVFSFGTGSKKSREIVFETGENYIVEPINPLKKKNRNRTCTLIAIGEFKSMGECIVKLHDTKRESRIDMSDLVPAE